MKKDSRIEELVKSANKSDAMVDCQLNTDECKILFDHGWTHALDIVSRGFFLVEVENTGWFVVEERDEAMKVIRD